MSGPPQPPPYPGPYGPGVSSLRPTPVRPRGGRRPTPAPRLRDPVTFTDKATGDEVEQVGTSVDWNVGAGLWLTIAGGAAMVVVSIVGLVKRR